MTRWLLASMMALSILTLMALSILPAPMMAQEAVSSTTTAVTARGPVEVPLTTRSGELWVDVKLNDRVTARMLLDTGASVVILPAKVATSLGLDTQGKRQELKTLKGVVMGRWVTLDRVGLGAAAVEDVSAIVLEDGNDEAVGLLGRSFLNHFSFSIDLDRGTLTLNPRRSGAAAMNGITPTDYLDRQLELLNQELARASHDPRASSNYIQQIQRSVTECESRRTLYR
jgi:clan AA aspartic protease (TIGR02281 family)